MAHLGPSLILQSLGEKSYVSRTLSAGQKWSSTEGLETSCYSILRPLFTIKQNTQNLNWDLPYFGKKKNTEYFESMSWKSRFVKAEIFLAPRWSRFPSLETKDSPMTSINLGAWGYINIQKRKITEANHPGFWLESTFKIYTSAPVG